MGIRVQPAPQAESRRGWGDVGADDWRVNDDALVDQHLLDVGAGRLEPEDVVFAPGRDALDPGGAQRIGAAGQGNAGRGEVEDQGRGGAREVDEVAVCCRRVADRVLPQPVVKKKVSSPEPPMTLSKLAMPPVSVVVRPERSTVTCSVCLILP